MRTDCSVSFRSAKTGSAGRFANPSPAQSICSVFRVVGTDPSSRIMFSSAIVMTRPLRMIFSMRLSRPSSARVTVLQRYIVGLMLSSSRSKPPASAIREKKSSIVSASAPGMVWLARAVPMASIVGWICARSSSQESRGMTQDILSGATLFVSRNSAASTAVLPAPTITKSANCLLSLGRSFRGTQ